MAVADPGQGAVGGLTVSPRAAQESCDVLFDWWDIN